MKRNNNRHKYFNKVPPFKPDPHHWTRKGPHGWKAKVAYQSEDEAWEFLKLHPRIMEQGYTAYQCHVCSMWHVGHLRDGE